MPDTNPNGFDPTFLLKGLSSFFSLLNKNDRGVLSTVFEQLFRSLDDAHHELNQVNRSKDFIEVQPYTQRDWLLRDLTTAERIATPHGHFDVEFTAVGGETSFVIGRPVETGPTTVLFINGVETAQGAGWTFDLSNPLNPTVKLAYGALAGDVFRLYASDTVSLSVTTANGVQTVFSFSTTVDVDQVRIFHNNVELTGSSMQIRKREVLFGGGLSSGDVVNFRKGAQMHNVVAAAGQVRVTCPFDIDDATIIRLGGINIRDGWVVSDTNVAFKNAPRSGVSIKLQAPKVTPHDHEVYAETSTLGQTVINTSTDLGLDPGFVYNQDRPILLVINGLVVDQALYTFTGANQITMTVPLLAGDQIQVYYHNDTEYQHAHPDYQVTLVQDLPAEDGLDLKFLETDKPAFVFVDGILLREGLGSDAFQLQGGKVFFGKNLLAGSRILVIAEKYQWLYRVGPPEWDATIVWVSAIQNGIDLPTATLLPEQDFIVHDGYLYLNQVFSNAWLKDVQLNLETPYNNFGYLIDFRMPNSPTYVDLLKSLWAAYVGGPRHYVLQNFGRIMLGAPPAQFPGVVQTVTTGTAASTVDILGDDGVLRRFTVTGMPVAVVPQQRVDRFTALGASVNVIDHVSEPDWYQRFPHFLYAIEKFGSTFETGALFDKGLTSTYRVSAIDPYDSVTHSIVVTPTAFDFRLLQDLNDQECLVTIRSSSGARYETRLIPQARNTNNVPAVEDLGWGFRLNFDPAFFFAAPPAAALPQTVELRFERQRRLDLDFVFDEYINEHLDPVAEQIYGVLRSNMFALDIPSTTRVDKDRMELLFTLVERVRAVETSYIVLGELPGVSENLGVTTTESTPSDLAANFSQIHAYLAPSITAYGISYYGP